jgi:hypothetical protein
MPLVTIKNVDSTRVLVKDINYSTKVTGIYPFRVRFQNIGFSVPPSSGIGVAVIGSSFVIL